MCLRSKIDKPLIAEEDIVCYKILERVPRWFFGFKWLTPWRFMHIPNAVLSGKRLLNARGKRVVLESLGFWLIENGYIHVYGADKYNETELEILSKEASDGFNYKGKAGAHMFKCVIPKGTEYYDGWNCHSHQYAARSIKFVEQVF